MSTNATATTQIPRLRPWFGVASLILPAALAAQQPARPDTLGTMRQGPAPASMSGPELPHPFFTHMGMPEGVGVYSLRVDGLANQGVNPAMGGRQSDFFFHLETGLTKQIGLHVRNDQFRSMPRTEAMFQFLALQSRDGRAGFAPVIEFEVPTRPGPGSRFNTLTGFTTAVTRSRVAFNSALHFNPRDNAMDYSGGWVVAAGRRFFPVVEVLGTAGRGLTPGVRLLGGFKMSITDRILIGLAVQVPVTAQRDFGRQFVFGPDFDWSTRRTPAGMGGGMGP